MYGRSGRFRRPRGGRAGEGRGRWGGGGGDLPARCGAGGGVVVGGGEQASHAPAAAGRTSTRGCWRWGERGRSRAVCGVWDDGLVCRLACEIGAGGETRGGECVGVVLLDPFRHFLANEAAQVKVVAGVTGTYEAAQFHRAVGEVGDLQAADLLVPQR